jgi:hypothetical protein
MADMKSLDGRLGDSDLQLDDSQSSKALAEAVATGLRETGQMGVEAASEKLPYTAGGAAAGLAMGLLSAKRDDPLLVVGLKLVLPTLAMGLGGNLIDKSRG